MNQQDKSFLITFTTVMSVLVLIAVVIFFAAQLVGMVGMAPADTARQEATIDERIQPVGRVRVAASSSAQPTAAEQAGGGQQAAAPASAAPAGADVYNSACAACHAAGVLNAPKLGSKEDWEPRYAQGLDTLVSHAINGINTMPAKGGNAALSDDQVHDAVVYMLGESGLEVAAAGTVAEATAATAEAAPAVAAATAPVPAPAAGANVAAVDEALAALQEDVKAIDKAISALRAELAKDGAGEASQQQAPPAAQEAPAGEESAPTNESPAAEQAAAAPAAVDLAKGEEVYKAACFACHMTGAAAAPMLTDKAAWETRAQQGMDLLVNHAVNGLNAMPAKGGNPNLSEQDIRNATAYMLNQAGVEAAAAPATGAVAAEPAVAEAAQQPAAEEAAPAVAEEPAQPAPEPQQQATAEPASDLPASVDLEQGKQLYQTTCVVCHQNGVAGAPKYGDKNAWAPRVEQGFEQLVEHSLNGYKGMPARGGKMDVPDEEIIAAVAYMMAGVK